MTKFIKTLLEDWPYTTWLMVFLIILAVIAID